QAPPVAVALAGPRRTTGASGRTSAQSGLAAPHARRRARSIAPSPYYYAATTTIAEVDVHEPAAMKVQRTMSVEGTFVDARQNGAIARLVFSSAPRAIATPSLRAHLSGWVPARRFHSFITGHRYRRAVAACTAVRRPAQFSGTGTLSI